MYIRFLFIFLFSNVINYISAQTYVFAQLQGTPVNTSGWNLQGDARVGNILNNNSSEVIICSIGGNKSGAIFYNQPINLSICKKWKAEFDFRIYDGNGADGLAFCFLDTPPVGFVTGQGLGIPATANGLKVCFDTYNNCMFPTTANMPKVEIRYGAGYDECWNQPTADNAGGNLSFIRSASYNHALIEYNDGAINVSVNGKLLLTANQQFNFSGYLGFTASVGGSNDNHSIKNAIIYTDMPPSVAGGVNGIASICSNKLLQLGTNASAGYVYNWSPATGLSDAATANPVLQYNNTSDTTISTTYYVKTAFAASPGCFSTDSVKVSIRPNPKVNFGIPGICLNDAIANFTDSSFTKDNASLPLNYSWNFDDALATPLNPNSSVLKNPSHVYKAAKTYMVKSIVTSAAGCIDSLTKPFTVNGSVPKADFNFLTKTDFCSGDTVAIIDNSSVDFGKLTRIDIYWDAINHPTAVETYTNPDFKKRYTHFYDAFISPFSQTISIRYDVYSGVTCINSVIKTFNLLAKPKIVFPAISSLCKNNPAYPIATPVELSGMAGNGIFSGKGVNAKGLFTPNMAGTFTLQYLFTANNGCKDSAVQPITVWQTPIINAGPGLSVLEGNSALIQASSGSNNLTYLWAPATYLNNDTLLQPTTTPLKNITYIVQATDSNGCKASDTVIIKVLLKPIAPNAFSPNGDGINDTWIIGNLKDYPNCIVQVFNRTGQIVFESVGYNTPWDGTFKGTPLPIGTYYYIIQPKNGRAPMGGSVTIIR